MRRVRRLDTECAERYPAVRRVRIVQPGKIRCAAPSEALGLRPHPGRLRLMLPGQNEEQTYPDTNRAIRHVESRKTRFPAVTAHQVKIQKVDHVSDPKTIQEIAENASKNEPEGYLAAEAVGIKLMPREK